MILLIDSIPLATITSLLSTVNSYEQYEFQTDAFNVRKKKYLYHLMALLIDSIPLAVFMWNSLRVTITSLLSTVNRCKFITDDYTIQQWTTIFENIKTVLIHK